MAKRGFDVAVFKATTSTSTGAYHDLSQYVDTISAPEIQALLEETHAMGDAWVEHSYIGVRMAPEITFSGPYEDVAASGPVAIFGNATDVGAERNIKVEFGGGGAFKVDVIVKSFKKIPTRSALTRFEAVLQPTGAVTTSS